MPSATPSPYALSRRVMQERPYEVAAAHMLFSQYCGEPICSVPGMATDARLAVRLGAGRTVEEAAAREYLYRWGLALQSPIFGVPHALGM